MLHMNTFSLYIFTTFTEYFARQCSKKSMFDFCYFTA